MIQHPSQSRRNFRMKAANKMTDTYDFSLGPYTKLKGSQATAYKKYLNNPEFQLTELERSLIYGETLTDATITKRGENYRMRIGHCKQQKQLVLWEYERLKALCRTTRDPKFIGQGNFVDFYLSSGKYLGPIHDQFYQKIGEIPDGKGGKKFKLQKQITVELLDQMPKSAECLAIIFLCDGSVRNDAYSGRIALHSFSQAEQLLFVDWLSAVHGVDAHVIRHTVRSGQYCVSISAKSFGKFIHIIEPVVIQIPDLRYKLNEARKIHSKHL